MQNILADYLRDKERTLAEFQKGFESGAFPCEKNNQKALLAVIKRGTTPLVRAYWSGYLCNLSQEAIDNL